MHYEIGVPDMHAHTATFPLGVSSGDTILGPYAVMAATLLTESPVI